MRIIVPNHKQDFDVLSKKYHSIDNESVLAEVNDRCLFVPRTVKLIQLVLMGSIW